MRTLLIGAFTVLAVLCGFAPLAQGVPNGFVDEEVSQKNKDLFSLSHVVIPSTHLFLVRIRSLGSILLEEGQVSILLRSQGEDT